MTQEEYELCKRGLEEQLHAGIELLQAVYRQQVRALDLLWRSGAEEDAKFALAAETLPASLAVPAVLQAPPRRKAGELRDDVWKALANVPEVFTRNDVCEQLGYEPNRGSLYRILQDLLGEGVLSMEYIGEGRQPSRYRKGTVAGRPADV
ncbi:MAG TPA: hypothetical protein VGG03_05905 [Thermoanaerobaculia bacterium]|jgi:hypothetical protein